MRAVIIEDERKNIVQLKGLLARHCVDIKVVGTAENADMGLLLVQKELPELLFLDIEMPGTSIFDMLRALKGYEFEVIFVTAHNQYGIQAVKFSALDYLLKPIKAEELIEAVNKARIRKTRHHTATHLDNMLQMMGTNKKSDHRIILPMMKETRLVNPETIIRCESINNCTLFFLQEGEKLLVAKPIKEYAQLLAPYNFIRCHQTHLVNKSYIKSLLKEDNVSELLLLDKTTIPVSRLKLFAVKTALNIR